MNLPSTPKAIRVEELDGLRGLLAMWVAVSHIICMCGFHALPLPASLEHAWIEFVFAEPAVECFIILSGFAISYLLANRPQRYSAYLTGRFLRLYPVYISCIIVALTTLSLAPFVLSTPVWHNNVYYEWIQEHINNTQRYFGPNLLLHATMLHGLPTHSMLPDSTSAILGPAWSITLEWQYYLVAPFVARAIKSTVGILILTAVAWLGLRFSAPWENSHLGFLPAQLPLFLIGISSYHLYAWLSRLPMDCTLIKNLLVASLIGAAIVLHWHRTAIVIWSLVFGCILASGSDPLTRLLSMLRQFLLHPWLQRLGKASYSLYLVHFPLIILLLYVLLQAAPHISAPHALLFMLTVGLPIILLATTLLHRLVELPGMRLGRIWSRRIG